MAGPLFNFLFAFLAYGAVAMIGISGLKPQLGGVIESSPAAVAGLQSGDEIVAVNGTPVVIWQQALEEIVTAVVASDGVDLEVMGTGGERRQHRLEASFGGDIPEGGALLQGLGLEIDRPRLPPRLGTLVSGGAAEAAGLQSGDLVVSVMAQPVSSWEEWVEWIQRSPEQPLVVLFERDGVPMTLELVPQRVELETGRVIGRIGAEVELGEYRRSHLRELRLGPLQALIHGVEKSWQMSWLTLRMMGRMVTGEASTKQLGGPITIARYAGSSMESGLVPFFSFLGLLSVSLGVLNLLPIPILDGGHLLFYLLEWVRGAPLSERVMGLGQQLGGVFLVGLMALVLYNDVHRLL